MNNEKVINPTSTYIDAYNEFEANLVQLEEQTKDAVVDLTTKQGIKDCQDAAKRFMKVRTGVEKARKEITKDSRDYINKVNDDAKAITARILPLEHKFKAPLEQRKQAFKDKLAEIDAMPSVHANSSSEVISAAIGELSEIQPTDFAEFKKDCEASLFTANDKLTDLLSQAVAREEAERKAEEERKRQAEEAERQAKALAEQQKREKIQARITKLQQVPLGLMGKKAKEIKETLDKMKDYEPTAEEFEERLTEVQGMMQITIGQLEMMLTQAQQLEEMQAQQAEAATVEQATFDNNGNDQHSDNCQGCPDRQGINCEITEAAAKEEMESITQLSEEDAPMFTDTVADAPATSVVENAMAEVCTDAKQEEAAIAICEVMAGEITLEQALAIVGNIDGGVIPYITFND